MWADGILGENLKKGEDRKKWGDVKKGRQERKTKINLIGYIKTKGVIFGVSWEGKNGFRTDAEGTENLKIKFDVLP